MPLKAVKITTPGKKPRGRSRRRKDEQSPTTEILQLDQTRVTRSTSRDAKLHGVHTQFYKMDDVEMSEKTPVKKALQKSQKKKTATKKAEHPAKTRNPSISHNGTDSEWEDEDSAPTPRRSPENVLHARAVGSPLRHVLSPAPQPAKDVRTRLQQFRYQEVDRPGRKDAAQSAQEVPLEVPLEVPPEDLPPTSAVAPAAPRQLRSKKTTPLLLLNDEHNLIDLGSPPQNIAAPGPASNGQRTQSSKPPAKRAKPKAKIPPDASPIVGASGSARGVVQHSIFDPDSDSQMLDSPTANSTRFRTPGRNPGLSQLMTEISTTSEDSAGDRPSGKQTAAGKHVRFQADSDRASAASSTSDGTTDISTTTFQGSPPVFQGRPERNRGLFRQATVNAEDSSEESSDEGDLRVETKSQRNQPGETSQPDPRDSALGESANQTGPEPDPEPEPEPDPAPAPEPDLPQRAIRSKIPVRQLSQTENRLRHQLSTQGSQDQEEASTSAKHQRPQDREKIETNPSFNASQESNVTLRARRLALRMTSREASQTASGLVSLPAPAGSESESESCLGIRRQTSERLSKEFQNSPPPLPPAEKLTVKMPNNYSQWRIVMKSFQRSCDDFEALKTLLNQCHPDRPSDLDFPALEGFIKLLQDYEAINNSRRKFFRDVVPALKDIALQTPELLKGGLEVIQQKSQGVQVLSQAQAACLLANGFFCNFPEVGVMSAGSSFNFSTLFEGVGSSAVEKLKCLHCYLEEIVDDCPNGPLKFERVQLPIGPSWGRMKVCLGDGDVEIVGSHGSESRGVVAVQTSGPVGGDVFGLGAGEEETACLVHPEMLVARLFVEPLGDDEVLMISGVRKYSEADGLRFRKKCGDSRPRDFAFIRKMDGGRDERSLVARLNNLFVMMESVGSEFGSSVRVLMTAPAVGHDDVILEVLLVMMAAAVARIRVTFAIGDDAYLGKGVDRLMGLVGDGRMEVQWLFRELRKYVALAELKRPPLCIFLECCLEEWGGFHQGLED